MGTVVSYRIEPGDLSDGDVRAAIDASTAELHRLDDVFSTWKADSPMSRLRRGELTAEAAPAEIAIVLRLCETAKEATGGWFDPWALPGGVDPTGLVKGWVLERAAELLEVRGVPAAMVNGGGDIVTFGSRWAVGIRHPWRADALACVVVLTSGVAVATSGTYERGEHLVDPFAERGGAFAAGSHGMRHPAVISASVVGPSLTMADAFATALAVAGPAGDPVAEQLAAEGYESYRIFDDGAEAWTPGFPLEGAAALS
jgi:thiamine biosynthesis lipoprotein